MPDVHITHHALIRYLERVRGFKLDRERAALQRICKGITNGSIRLDGHIYTIKNGNLVTVAPVGNGPCKLRKSDLARGVEA